MSVTPGNIIVGAAVVKVSDYVAAKGAGTFTDVGGTLGGTMWIPKRTYHDIKTDQFLGTLRKVPIDFAGQLKFKMLEGTLANFRLAMEQPSANLTGTPPNLTLKIDYSAAEQYHQLQLIGVGLGTNKVRTVTAWKCVFGACAEVPFRKDAEWAMDTTVDVLEEIDGAGVDDIDFVDS